MSAGSFKVEWTEVAVRDFERLAVFLVAENPLRAGAILDRIAARADSLSHLPERGRVLPELRGIADRTWRELQERPWRIVYRIGPGRVVYIHGVFDGRRSLEDILSERLLSS